MSTSKNMIESLRDIVQDFLVPGLKAVKISLESLRQEMKTSDEALRQEMRLRDELTIQAIRNLSEKLEYSIDIRERLAAIEASLPRQ